MTAFSSEFQREATFVVSVTNAFRTQKLQYAPALTA